MLGLEIRCNGVSYYATKKGLPYYDEPPGDFYLWPDGLLRETPRDESVPLCYPEAWPGYWRSREELEAFMESLNNQGAGI